MGMSKTETENEEQKALQLAQDQADDLCKEIYVGEQIQLDSPLAKLVEDAPPPKKPKKRVRTKEALKAKRAASGAKESELLNPRKQVVMSNRFIVAGEQGTRFAHRISRVAISQIPMDTQELPKTVITTDDILQMGLAPTRLTGHMKEVIDELLSYRIYLASHNSRDQDPYENESKLTGIAVFGLAAAVQGTGAIEVQLNPILREHFLNLRADFTQYSLPIAVSMPGIASGKLHELLLSRSRQYGADLLRFKIEDLVPLLNYCPKGDFKASTFVTNVIKRSVEAINKFTECRVEYKAIKTGREYTDIRFFVESSYRTLEEKERKEAWIKRVIEEGGEGAGILLRCEEDIKRRLNDGEDELYLTAQNHFAL